VETHGPLGVIWVSIGLGAFYMALIWINSLLGIVLTPLFVLLLDGLRSMIVRRKPAPPVA
jgi:apolipoprotein N-acyltransferase